MPANARANTAPGGPGGPGNPSVPPQQQPPLDDKLVISLDGRQLQPPGSQPGNQQPPPLLQTGAGVVSLDADFNLLSDQFGGDAISFDLMPMDALADMDINLIPEGNMQNTKFDTDRFSMGF